MKNGNGELGIGNGELRINQYKPKFLYSLLPTPCSLVSRKFTENCIYRRTPIPLYRTLTHSPLLITHYSLLILHPSFKENPCNFTTT
ncbi:MAG: hypothetical protein F6K47_12990 [Symploca sp. SIO2E6]|nr:hypothetical protein [Symploca sp. SIO2E6]